VLQADVDTRIWLHLPMNGARAVMLMCTWMIANASDLASMCEFGVPPFVGDSRAFHEVGDLVSKLLQAFLACKRNIHHF
jgi:hypothetical protein